ncbi:MAG: transposase [Deltaproteobacteria bacterium]|nr:transposase [Deltaproteobacteria bacterium]
MSNLHSVSRSPSLSNPLSAHYERMPSDHFGRPVHMWTFGHAGWPLIAFPTAGGYAHEWQHHGVVDALGDLLALGKVRLYCPETNVCETWTSDHWDVGHRMRRHDAYERFVVHELVPRIRRDSGRRDLVAMGASVGAMYAVNFALKYPELFSQAVGFSGRYNGRFFTDGWADDGVYFSDPLAYAWNLDGEHLQRVRAQTHVTLVCGRGNFEQTCLAETEKLAKALSAKGIPLWRDIWGNDVSHEWVWWRRQIRMHVARRSR